MKNLQRTYGFTLAELAIVLVIVALLMGGLLIPLATQRDVHNINQTKSDMNDIREALIGYALANGRLPCPADKTIATGATGAGLEATTAAGGPCSCTAATTTAVYGGTTACQDTNTSSVTGNLPWATLGLPETDAWGNRYIYRVSHRFARAASGQTAFGGGGGSCTPTSTPTNAAFALCTTGNIKVEPSAANTNYLANYLPAIVVSMGSNGASGATNDEQQNKSDDDIFVSNTTIDDLLIWISPNLLFNRMVSAGKLP